MTATADFVVAGAGHNSLITAAYLARAGHEVVVLEARPIPGGGAASEELLAPGYIVDSCSTGHTLIQTNPLLRNDELGLLGRYGLEYIEPDPFAHVVFPDGRDLTMWLDLDRSCEELARFSARDGETYRRMIAEYDAVKHLFAASRFTPPGFGPSLEQMLREHPDGRKWMRRRMMSSWDVIRHEYESEHVRSFMLWQAFQTLVPVDSAGSGPLAYSIVFGRQHRGWTVPRGGSGQLADALVRCIADDGGTVLCDRPVARLVLDGGRCVGVETKDGERFEGRRGVVSTIHVKHLIDMAPADAWDEDFRYGVETYDVGLSGFAVYLATTAPPAFETNDGQRTAVSAGLAGWPQQLVDHGRRLRDGIYDPDPAWLLVATPTLVDPSRAPAGHHTVKFLSGQAWGLPDGESSWDKLKERQANRQLERVRRFAPGLTDDAIITRLVKSPVDIERQNWHMIHGAFHGGDRGLAQMGGLRPAPGWAQHRMPIDGLYQTGGTTHPGGSITGAPGRNAATVILADLGTNIDEVIGATPRAARGAATVGRG
jgi:phytoene dehydrogenase-like protein